MKLPIYPWFDVVPDHLKTRNQLGALGLKPGGPVVARVEWDTGRKYANLYQVEAAQPKRQLSADARARIDEKKRGRRTCPVCRRVMDQPLHHPVCWDCADYHPDGSVIEPIRLPSVASVQPYRYTVFAPATTPLGPYAAAVPAQYRYLRWIPYPVIEFRLMLETRAYGPLLLGHTHITFTGRPIAAVLAGWDQAAFLAWAERWPILRDWAIDASLPGDQWLAWAMAGLPKEDAAEMRVIWYERRTLYHDDMRRLRG